MQSDRSLMLQHFLNAESQFSSVAPMFSCNHPESVASITRWSLLALS